ncbi:MAG: spore cortex biosynthesis protein YabQ [Oscillospiraceae bacterium]|nr:spore cortex biosynthesis protein YabQ [Oscillospiraceae bacterium]
MFAASLSVTEQGIIFLFSCAVGGFLGVFYDVFRIIRIAFNSGWLSVFFQDIIFCVLSAFSVILLVFYTNSGTVRWFSMLGCFMCFVLYHVTIGRIIMFLSKKIIDSIKKALGFLYKITVIPVKYSVLFILRNIRKLLYFILGVLKILKSDINYIKEKRKLTLDASRGFNLYKTDKKIYKKYYKNHKKTAKSLGQIIKKDSVKNQETIEKSTGKV